MEMTMKKTALGLSLAALVLAGSAHAAPAAPSLKRDADRNGVITRAEAQAAAAAIFTRMDANKDGKLDQADRAARREAMQTRMFERLDTNKDGQLTRAEFMADNGRGRPGARFSRRGAGRHEGKPQGAGQGRNFAAAMTQDQFVAKSLQRFDASDANKDGQVTPAERQAAREQRKAQRQQARAQRSQG